MRKRHTHLWRGKLGPARRRARPDGLWALALFDEDGKKRLFLTVPLGDSYHGYKSNSGACHCQLNIKSGLSLSHCHKKIHTRGRWRLMASSGLLPE